MSVFVSVSYKKKQMDCVKYKKKVVVFVNSLFVWEAVGTVCGMWLSCTLDRGGLGI